jgi:predicted DCC family thiol-disulfide oxidoreductase YuxK
MRKSLFHRDTRCDVFLFDQTGSASAPPLRRSMRRRPAERAMGAITVYYDGLCPLCGREVALYRRLVAPGTVVWRDLAGDPRVLRYEPFGMDAALALLHVRDADGALHVGLPAHLVLWERLPALRGLARGLRRCAFARRVFERFYLAFTARRPGLRRDRGGGRHA